MVILELIRASRPDFVEGLCLLGTEPTQALPGPLVIHDNRTNRMASAGDESFKFLTYQLPTVGYWPTVAMTGNGELGFDSGEGGLADFFLRLFYPPLFPLPHTRTQPLPRDTPLLFFFLFGRGCEFLKREGRSSLKVDADLFFVFVFFSGLQNTP